MEDKVWFLAAAGKTVGPMTVERVMERLATGKVPKKTKAWKEGVDEWLPLSEIPEFALAATNDAEEIEPAGAPVPLAPPAAPRVAPPPPPASSGSRAAATKIAPRRPVTSAGRRPTSFFLSIFSTPETLPLTYQPPHRIEKKDRWRAFGMGLDRSRAAFSVTMMFVSGLTTAVLGGMTVGAMQVHPFLGLPIALIAFVVSLALPLVAAGGLSFQAREQLRGAPTPGVKETLAFARKNFAALGTVPFALTLGTLVPFILLAILSLIIKIPYAGPVVSGLAYGAHLALGAAALFLMLASSLSWVFCPVIVGFEETNARGTIQILFDFVKRSLLRFVTWGFLPSLAYLFFGGVVFYVGALIVLIPLGMNAAIVAPEVLANDFPEALPAGLTVGLIPAALWIGLFVAFLVGILQSTQNALISILYLAGRRGNDDLITRDAAIARRAEAEKV